MAYLLAALRAANQNHFSIDEILMRVDAGETVDNKTESLYTFVVLGRHRCAQSWHIALHIQMGL